MAQKSKDSKYQSQTRKWHKTPYPGVRFKEHETRRHGKNFDRYFAIRYKVDGKLKEEGLGWSSKGWNLIKAANLRSELLENQRRGEGPVTLKQKQELGEALRKEAALEEEKNLTFEQAAKRFLAWGKLNKKSWKHDKARLKHFEHLLNPLKLKDITTAHIEEVKAHCQEQDLAPATVRHCLALIRTIFNYCTRLDLFQGVNPVKKVAFPKKDNRRIRFLTYEESEQLLEALARRSQDVHDQALLALYTGMRAGEIFSLRFNHIDFENRIINIMDPKPTDGQARQAYMTDRIFEMLFRRKQEIKQKQEANGKQESKVGLVFESRFGGRIQGGVSDSFERTLQDLGWNEDLEDPRYRVCFHSLRHTFASWLALQGEQLQTIQELLGHKTIQMTLRYSHLIPDQKRAAVAKLGKKAKGRVIDIKGAKKTKAG